MTVEVCCSPASTPYPIISSALLSSPILFQESQLPFSTSSSPWPAGERSMACATITKQFFYSVNTVSNVKSFSPLPLSRAFVTTVNGGGDKQKRFSRLAEFYTQRNLTPAAKSSPGSSDIVAVEEDPEDGVSLGTLKLPSNTDIPRFETLLFQWANSLCQGANLPLPSPLKVDKIPGGARLGFSTIDDGKTEVLVYIDCLVFPATSGSGPVFRAIRNGPLKETSPPGEPRIMRSLLQALQKSVEIARI